MMNINKNKKQLIKTYSIQEGNSIVYYVVLSRNIDGVDTNIVHQYQTIPVQIKEVKGVTLRNSKQIEALLINKLERDEYNKLRPNLLNFDLVGVDYSVDYPFGEIKVINGNTYLNLFNFYNDNLKAIIKNNNIIGEFPLIKSYLTNIFDNGYDAFINYISYRYQNPLVLIPISFVLVGKAQIGKSYFVEHFLTNIFGSKNVTSKHISKIDALKFNGDITGRMFVNFDEYNLDSQEAVEYFKNAVTQKTQKREKKGSNIEEIPNFCNYIFTQNDIPKLLETMGDKRRFITRHLTSKLYVEGSSVNDFVNEIPYFINFIANYKATKPVYEDFDICNKTEMFGGGNNDIALSITKRYFDSILSKIELNCGEYIQSSTFELKKDDLEKLHKLYVNDIGEDLIRAETPFKNFKTLQELIFNDNNLLWAKKTNRSNYNITYTKDEIKIEDCKNELEEMINQVNHLTSIQKQDFINGVSQISNLEQYFKLKIAVMHLIK